MARLALVCALPVLAFGSALVQFTTSRCGAIDWASPEVEEAWWRAMPRVALPLAPAEFDRSFGARHARTPAVLLGLMDAWPALRTWSPAFFREHYGDKQVEVFFWGRSGLDWNARTRIESMSIRRFVDDIVLSTSRGAQPGYVQESSFLEDEDEDDGADGEGSGGGASDARLPAPDAEPAAAHSAAVRAARARVSRLVASSKARAWADVLWFPHAPLPAVDTAVIETAFWLGGAGVGTGIHYDASPAFLHQVHGVKRVVLWPPSARARLAPSAKYNYGAELSEIDPRAFLVGHPLADEPSDAAARARVEAEWPRFGALPNVTVDLQPGETLAVPPGWWHATLTMSPSISVAVRVQSACQKRAEWFDDLLLALHNAGLYKRGQCVCHSDAAARGTGR
ncbi:hypothetical protein KFE25_003510 [Diacronema lutheri]|uniref:JmjC domain-containing protein n=1 Tax=Diacronema lutheri TaxID=2081491 RepID=A0A8J5XMG4_DIALT|nr:hypothetical protein KFE25_003510 [Diacronema lutheri]